MTDNFVEHSSTKKKINTNTKRMTVEKISKVVAVLPHPADPGYGHVYFNPETGMAHIVMSDGDTGPTYDKWKEAVGDVDGVKEVKAVAETPPTGDWRGEGWVRIGRSGVIEGNLASIDENTHPIFALIDQQTATADDFNNLIREAMETSIHKRIQRNMRPKKFGPRSRSPGRKVDDVTDHEPSGHNDPRSTSRGRSAQQKRVEYNKEHPEEFREAIEFLNVNRTKPLAECDVSDIRSKQALERLVTRLLREPGTAFDTEWLYGLKRMLSESHVN